MSIDAKSNDQEMFQRGKQATYKVKQTLIRLLGRISSDQGVYS